MGLNWSTAGKVGRLLPAPFLQPVEPFENRTRANHNQKTIVRTVSTTRSLDWAKITASAEVSKNEDILFERTDKENLYLFSFVTPPREQNSYLMTPSRNHYLNLQVCMFFSSSTTNCTDCSGRVGGGGQVSGYAMDFQIKNMLP